MLSTFRRELANYLIRVDPDRFLRLYHKARVAEAAVEAGDKKQRDAQLTMITERYPLYQDFDLIGTREHVLYADAFNMYPLEDIEEHFLNLVRFHALERAADEDWKFRDPATSDKNLEHLHSYVLKIKDTRFRQRIIAAVSQFFAHKRGNWSNRVEGPIAYETDALQFTTFSTLRKIDMGFTSRVLVNLAFMAHSPETLARLPPHQGGAFSLSTNLPYYMAASHI